MLLQALRDPDHNVRLAALGVFARGDKTNTVVAALRMLRDEDDHRLVRKRAAETLSIWGER